MIYWVGGARREEAEHRAAVEEIIDFLEIQSIRNEPAGVLSYGLRKRVELARAIALKPELILLDEPMAGMNLEEKEDMARFIVDLNEEWGMTVVMIEHDMGVVMDLSHRLMVLDFGRKIAEGLPDEIKASADVRRRLSRRGTRRSRSRTGNGDHAMTFGIASRTWPTTTRCPSCCATTRDAHGTDVALREKELGLWKSYTWVGLPRARQAVGAGAASLGVGQGDTVAIIGDNRPDWLAAAIAAHALRAKSLGLYQDGLEAEVGYLVAYAEAKVVIAEDEEQVDKMLRVTAGIPSVQKIVYCDPRGMRKYTDPRLVERDALLEAARKTAPPSRPCGTPRRPDRRRGRRRAVLDLRHHLATQARQPHLRPVHPARRHAIASCSISGPTTSTSRCCRWAGSASNSRPSISRWCAATSSTSSRNPTRS